MPIYNVLIPIVGCVIADSEEAAIEKLANAAQHAGFDVYPEGQNAFESEDDVEVSEL